MTTATQERIHACLVREGVCADEAAERVAAVIAEEIEIGDSQRVTEDRFEARLAQIDARIAQLGREFAERDARLSREFAERDARLAREMQQFIADMHELERERDERERQRDERERQRVRDQEERDAKMRQWVLGVVGLGFAAVTVVTGLIAAFT